MFKKFIKTITTTCEVIELHNKINVYPIYKNGRSSLAVHASRNNLKRYYNKDIYELKNITVFLREPLERFISGVHTYCYFKNDQKIDKTLLKKIENLDIVDRHFIPQYFWLLHLSKYYKNYIDFRSVSDLYSLIPDRAGPWIDGVKKWIPLTMREKKYITNIDHKKYTNVDLKIIIKYMNKRVKLEHLVKEFKNEVS